jgi:hypothetical protein
MKLKEDYQLPTDHETHDRRAPYVGLTVLFYPRQGDLGYVSREGCVPATILSVRDRDHVDLNLALAGVNPVVRSGVPRKSDRDPLGSWSFTEEHHHSNAAELQQLRDELRDLQEQVAELTAKHSKRK